MVRRRESAKLSDWTRRGLVGPSGSTAVIVTSRGTPTYQADGTPAYRQRARGSVCQVTTLDAPPGAGTGHRRRLLDGLAACIRERGYPDTTVADIVRAARTSRRTFYAQFADRQECLVA